MQPHTPRHMYAGLQGLTCIHAGRRLRTERPQEAHSAGVRQLHALLGHTLRTRARAASNVRMASSDRLAWTHTLVYCMYELRV